MSLKLQDKRWQDKRWQDKRWHQKVDYFVVAE